MIKYQNRLPGLSSLSCVLVSGLDWTIFTCFKNLIDIGLHGFKWEK